MNTGNSSAKQIDQQLANIADFFDDHGDLWIRAYRDKSEAWYQYFPLRLRERYACALIQEEKERGAAIDLGCGTGHALVEMKGIGFRRVIGVDISDRMIASTTKLLQDECLDRKVEVYQADVRNLTMIKSNSIDVCTALGVIEYLKDDDSLLKEIYRILKPGGAAVIQTRNYHCIRTRTVETTRKLVPFLRGKIWYRVHKPEVFRKTAESHGFNVENEVFTHFYALYPLDVVPGLRTLVKPLDNFLSKNMERRSSHSSSQRLASMYIVKLRKSGNRRSHCYGDGVP